MLLDMRLRRCLSVRAVRRCLAIGRDTDAPWTQKLDPARAAGGTHRAARRTPMSRVGPSTRFCSEAPRPVVVPRTTETRHRPPAYEPAHRVPRGLRLRQYDFIALRVRLLGR